MSNNELGASIFVGLVCPFVGLHCGSCTQLKRRAL